MPGMQSGAPLATAIATIAALIAFAANSVLCRLALAPDLASGETIDPASFTSLRLASGACFLTLVVRVFPGKRGARHADWAAAAMLFLYAAAFSFAYLSLEAGTGALILFGAVQATMIGAGLRQGERPSRLEWMGILTALGGLVLLVAPGLTAPSPHGALLMALAGVGWGVYSLRGRGFTDPIRATAGNFARTLPFLLPLAAAMLPRLQVSPRGALLAVTSGAIASGMGYVAWYTVLPRLTATRAATLQLAVPVLAACGGVLLLGETLTLRLVLAGAAILGGIGLAVRSRQAARPRRRSTLVIRDSPPGSP